MDKVDLENLKDLGMGAFEQIKEMVGEDNVKAVKDMIKDNPDMIKQAKKLIASQMPQKQRVKKIPPNSKCPCGSDKKYKKCCIGKPPPEQKREKAPREPTYNE